jgi:hypothetical protein
MKKLLSLLLFCGLLLAENSFAQTAAIIPESHPVAIQLKGYNARDIELFMSAYSDTVKVFTFHGKMMYQGKEAMRNRYSAMFESTPDLHCELINRMEMGNIVIDQEKVQRKKGQPRMDAIAIYKVAEGLIYEVTFLK